MCKVQWSNHTKDEATWEKEDQLKVEFPDIFSICLNLEGEIHPKGGRRVGLSHHNFWKILKLAEIMHFT
jgi:hypothetical protein